MNSITDYTSIAEKSDLISGNHIYGFDSPMIAL